MTKLLLLGAVSIFCVSFGKLANAQLGGGQAYIGAALGAGSITFDGTDQAIEHEEDQFFDTLGPDGVIFMGYDAPGPVRVEGRMTAMRLEEKFDLISAGTIVNTTLDFTSIGATVNMYAETDSDQGLNLYLGGGVGVSYNTGEMDILLSGLTTGSYTEEAQETGLAYNAVIGVSSTLSEGLEGFAEFAYNNHGFLSFPDAGSDVAYGISDVKFGLGLRGFF